MPDPGASWRSVGRLLHDGRAGAEALVLEEPLSFWGGLDTRTGAIVDRRHPQAGQSVSGRVLVMSAGRGSSSSSTVLAESLRAGTGPAAIILREADAIVVVGALVSEILDGRSIPVIQLGAVAFRRIRTGDHVSIAARGRLIVTQRG